MGNRKTEEERIERVIRGLSKLSQNRRCINCNLLGPQYVCTTFSTFVCTNCSGIHREFTHRVKSVSMAKFTSEEVTALQAGGNERAKQLYFKEWDPLRHSYPDSCNIHKLRDFIRHVYVERKFTGERSSDNLPKIRLNDKEESYRGRKNSSFRLEFKSPHSSPSPSTRSDDTNFRYLYDESRSPRYTQKYSRHGGLTRSPIKFEVVDDRFKDNDHRSRRVSNLESKLRQISIEDQKNVSKTQHPAPRALEEILRENAPSPHVTPSGGEHSVEENPSEQKINKPERSINFSTKSQVSEVIGIGPETPHMSQSNENNWAKFEASTESNDPITPNTNKLKPSTIEAASEAPTYAKNPIDLLLLELSSPMTTGTSGMSQIPSNDNNDPKTTTTENAYTWDFPPTSTRQTPTSPDHNTSVCSFISTTATELAQPSNEVPPHDELYDAKDNNKVSHEQKPSNMQYLPSMSTGYNSSVQPTNALIKGLASKNQPSLAPNSNDTSCAFTELSPQTTSKPTQETKPNVGSHPCKVETKSSERMELPEDLFTSSYLSTPASIPGWQNVQPHSMGYGMQYYPNALPPPDLPIAPKSSTNPFEVTEGRNLNHATSLPTMASLHGVPLVVSHRTGLMHASSLGTLGAMMSQSPSYASPISMGVYYDQVNNEEKPTRPQRADSFNGDISTIESLNPIQRSGGVCVAPEISNSFSNTRGNPFG